MIPTCNFTGSRTKNLVSAYINKVIDMTYKADCVTSRNSTKKEIKTVSKNFDFTKRGFNILLETGKVSASK